MHPEHLEILDSRQLDLTESATKSWHGVDLRRIFKLSAIN